MMFHFALGDSNRDNRPFIIAALDNAI